MSTSHDPVNLKLAKKLGPPQEESCGRVGRGRCGVHYINVEPSAKGPSLFGSQVSPKYKALYRHTEKTARNSIHTYKADDIYLVSFSVTAYQQGGYNQNVYYSRSS